MKWHTYFDLTPTRRTRNQSRKLIINEDKKNDEEGNETQEAEPDENDEIGAVNIENWDGDKHKVINQKEGNVKEDQVEEDGQDEQNEQSEETGYDLTTDTGFDAAVSRFKEIVTNLNAAVDEFNKIITTNILTEAIRSSSLSSHASSNNPNRGSRPNNMPEVVTVTVKDDSGNDLETESEDEVVVLEKKKIICPSVRSVLKNTWLN